MPSRRERIILTVAAVAFLAALALASWYLIYVDESPPQGPEPTIWDEPDPYF